MITLRKEAVQYLEAQRTGTPYYKVSPQEARAMRTVTQWQSAHKPKLASIEDHKITVRDGEQITVRLYTPVLGKTLPVIVSLKLLSFISRL